MRLYKEKLAAMQMSIEAFFFLSQVQAKQGLCTFVHSRHLLIRCSMDRRRFVQQGFLFVAGLSISPELLAKAPPLPPDQMATLAEMADTILPDTDVPGAKAAGVPDFIALVVESCFPADVRSSFWAGLGAADQSCRVKNGKPFVECNGAERKALFTELQAAAKAAPNPDTTFWMQLKTLTLHGYFNSETGATRALAYDPVPGAWIADMETDGDTRAWTPMF